MTQQPRQSPRGLEDAPERTATLWYDRTREQPRYPSYARATPQTPDEPRPGAFSHPGTGSAQPPKARRGAELVTIAAPAGGTSTAAPYAVPRVDNKS